MHKLCSGLVMCQIRPTSAIVLNDIKCFGTVLFYMIFSCVITEFVHAVKKGIQEVSLSLHIGLHCLCILSSV